MIEERAMANEVDKVFLLKFTSLNPISLILSGTSLRNPWNQMI
jgi:hypothetical protein